MFKKRFLIFIIGILFLCTIGILLLVTPSIMAQDQPANELDEQALIESLRDSCSPEQQSWYKQQHDLYINEHQVKPLERYEKFTVNYIPTTRAITKSVSRILVLINQSLYSNQSAKDRIDRYIKDVSNGHGCNVLVEILSGGSAEQIKDIIKQYYNNGGLDGVVQIGSLQPAWFFDPNPQYGGNFTCDLFFMDLDGTWQDTNGNGIYDRHDHGSGDRAPEIFYGRIDPATMGYFGTEVELLCSYMDKNHRYWTDQIPLKQSAFVQIEPDWQNSYNYVDRIYGAGNTEIIRGTGSRNDYVNNRLTRDYSFIHLWCHSSYTVHFFENGGELSYRDIYAVPPRPIGYAHDGCHCADWAAGNGRGFTVGAYVFNPSQTSLVAISGTKTGQWIGLQGRQFFEQLGNNECMGKAYKIWFDEYIMNARDYTSVIEWDYGYCIIGDPMITFKEVPAVGSPNTSDLGDVNSDGNVNVADALLISQYYVGINPNNFDYSKADTNCDGSVNITDALLVAQYYVGAITSFPCS